jgi:hypothetical protein
MDGVTLVEYWCEKHMDKIIFQTGEDDLTCKDVPASCETVFSTEVNRSNIS